MKVFDFGKNWQDFSEQVVDEERLTTAVESLQDLLQRTELSGVRFLDVGCGSGLFSIAAHRLGAAEVLGIDINPRCIAVSAHNRERFAPGSQIRFKQASALVPDTLLRIGQFDIVYAWGSLHHTGAMWDAIANTTTFVVPGGTLILGIYKKHLTSPAWTWIKWMYNQVPPFAQRMLAIPSAGIIYVAKLLVTGRNPLEKARGMDFWYDVIDWVGGYPYESATIEEMTTFVQARGFTLQRCIPDPVPTGINEFVFVCDATGSRRK